MCEKLWLSLFLCKHIFSVFHFVSWGVVNYVALFNFFHTLILKKWWTPVLIQSQQFCTSFSIRKTIQAELRKYMSFSLYALIFILWVLLKFFLNIVLKEYFICYIISSVISHLLTARAFENHFYNFLILCISLFVS